ncbi:MAG TPA: hypothetical protein VLT33_15335, partial [Labilithrix sp.]|nr:hypothetical protein [Labilithrix sp.]
ASPPPAIAPPPPMDPSAPGGPGDPSTMTSPEAATTRKLNEAESSDSGRNFEIFWLDAYIGGSYIDMRQFSSDTLAIEKAHSGGPMLALGAGIRYVLLVAGVRAKYNVLSAFNMWQLNGELGLKIPIDSVDLLLGAHGGYSFVGSIGEGTVSAGSSSTPTNNDAVKIRGFNVGLDIGVDYYLTKNFSLGAGVFGDFLFLKRPPVAKPDGLTAEQSAALDAEPLYQKSGTSAGMQLGAALRVGGHFGL